jgi:hypothetical protein
MPHQSLFGYDIPNEWSEIVRHMIETISDLEEKLEKVEEPENDGRNLERAFDTLNDALANYDLARDRERKATL